MIKLSCSSPSCLTIPNLLLGGTAAGFPDIYTKSPIGTFGFCQGQWGRLSLCAPNKVRAKCLWACCCFFLPELGESEKFTTIAVPRLSGLALPSLALIGALLMTWSDIAGEDIGPSASWITSPYTGQSYIFKLVLTRSYLYRRREVLLTGRLRPQSLHL